MRLIALLFVGTSTAFLSSANGTGGAERARLDQHKLHAAVATNPTAA